MPAYSARYDAALILAARAHRSQTRKGSDIPYIAHPVYVSLILLRYGFAEDVVIAGLLHDVVEDQDVPPMCIEAEFGPAVAEMVATLSERKREGGAPRPWRTRKEESLQHLRTGSLGAVAVRAADALHNAQTLAAQLRELGPETWTYYSRGPQESLWYYRSLVEVARDRMGSHPLVEEMEASVRELGLAAAANGGP